MGSYKIYGVSGKPELTDDFLEHHGIKGQKWGVRNGPPYPLNNSYGKKTKSVKKSSDKKQNEEVSMSKVISSIKKEASKVNPNYDEYDKKYSKNCVCCQVAYEIRRRGIDVEANPFIKGYYKNAKEMYQNVFNQPKDMEYLEYRAGTDDIKDDWMKDSSFERDIVKGLREQLGTENSRYFMNCKWIGGEVGHAFNLEIVTDSKTKETSYMIIDSQDLSVLKIEDAKWLQAADQFTFVRVDNLEIEDMSKVGRYCHERGK